MVTFNPDNLPADHAFDPAEVDLEKTRLLFQNAGLAQAVSAINATLLLFILGRFSPPLWVIGWWALALFTAAARYGLARRFLAAAPDASTAMLWRRRALVSALLAGLVWGGGGLVIMMEADESARLFAALVMAGMVAGAVPILSSVPEAFRAYTAPVMLSIIVPSLWNSLEQSNLMLAIVATLFLLALVRSASFFHDSLDKSIRLALNMRAMVEQLEAAKRGAEAASTAKGQFLAIMSHEIRTPLNGMLGMAQLLLMPGLREGEREEYAKTILASGQTLLALLNDVLDFSKVEAGRFELKPTLFSPEELLAETRSLFAETASSKGLAFATRWCGWPGQLYRGDQARLRQMLVNLANNALKFTSSGAVSIEVHPVSEGDGCAILEFSVTDTGIGIPEDKMELLFLPFSQIDGSNTRQYGGTGLGLSIVRNLARLMGGDAGVSSRPGQGSRFWFQVKVETLAADEPVDRERSAPAAANLPAARQGRHVGRRVLVVEDNAVNRKVVISLLAKLGLETESAENGDLAVQALSRQPWPDLVLMDCQMPVMDGFTATIMIRRLESEGDAASRRPRLPIVALTAGVFVEDRDNCLAAGMDDFLAKPVSLEQLRTVLDKWLPESGQSLA